MTSQGDRPARRVASTANRIERAAAGLAARSVDRMGVQLPWFDDLPAEQRATIGMITHQGIAGLARWLKDPNEGFDAGVAAFSVASSTFARTISLHQTVEMVKIAIDVVEESLGELAAPGDEGWLDVAVLKFSREIAFAAAFVYARAAEERGLWDARLEALVVDAIRRGDADDDLLSRAAALGWTSHDAVVAIAGWAPRSRAEEVMNTVHRLAKRGGLVVLAGVHGGQLVAILGDCPDPLVGAKAILPAFDKQAVVVGPVADGLVDANRSVAAALAGLRAAPAWPEAPRPVPAADLLPERALSGDDLARTELVADIFRPLSTAGEAVLSTVSAYIENGRSVEATARQLYVHPNTVRYRLGRAEAACGLTPMRPRDAHVLAAAIALGRLAEPTA